MQTEWVFGVEVPGVGGGQPRSGGAGLAHRMPCVSQSPVLRGLQGRPLPGSLSCLLPEAQQLPAVGLSLALFKPPLLPMNLTTERAVVSLLGNSAVGL